MKLRAIIATTAAVLLALLLKPPPPAAAAVEESCSGIVPMRSRREVISIEDFGGIGDGRTDNTWPFRKAIYRIQHLRRQGGTLLYVPRGVWLTASFNVTSHMTLYLAMGAVIKATQDTENWPLVEPLPSYGRGRERPGGRYASFILGYGLRDVIITALPLDLFKSIFKIAESTFQTRKLLSQGAHSIFKNSITTDLIGENGTIDGQGGVWWDMWRQRTLSFTRPNLLEFMHSTDVHISNIIFKNSPFWNIHPVYCSNVVIRSVTVLAPHDSPNTDGIDPDSSSNVCIEDSFISTGDDLVAVKSGWDEYGIAYGRPSSGITIRRITGSSPFSAIAIGSEASGGVENILIENINIYSTGIGIHIKTNAGRGGYIRNVTISDVYMSRVGKGVRIAGDVGDHPDDKFNPSALPRVDGVTIRNVWGVGVKEAGSIEGIKGSPFTRICLCNVRLWGVGRLMEAWQCAAVSGVAVGVQPLPCAELTGTLSTGFCYS